MIDNRSGNVSQERAVYITGNGMPSYAQNYSNYYAPFSGTASEYAQNYSFSREMAGNGYFNYAGSFYAPVENTNAYGFQGEGFSYPQSPFYAYSSYANSYPQNYYASHYPYAYSGAYSSYPLTSFYNPYSAQSPNFAHPGSFMFDYQNYAYPYNYNSYSYPYAAYPYGQGKTGAFAGNYGFQQQPNFYGPYNAGAPAFTPSYQAGNYRFFDNDDSYVVEFYGPYTAESTGSFEVSIVGQDLRIRYGQNEMKLRYNLTHFQIPADVNKKEISAKYVEGRLFVTLPREESISKNIRKVKVTYN